METDIITFIYFQVQVITPLNKTYNSMINAKDTYQIIKYFLGLIKRVDKLEYIHVFLIVVMALIRVWFQI
jgi:hypothetical protein